MRPPQANLALPQAKFRATIAGMLRCAPSTAKIRIPKIPSVPPLSRLSTSEIYLPGTPMKRSQRTPGLLCAVLAFLSCATAAVAQSPKPITYKGLLNSLKAHGLTNAELTQIVKTRGVDFELSADKESELKTAGADVDLLAAVRTSLRGALNVAPTGGGSPPPVSPPDPTPATPPPSQPAAEKDKPTAPANTSSISSIRD